MEELTFPTENENALHDPFLSTNKNAKVSTQISVAWERPKWKESRYFFEDLENKCRKERREDERKMIKTACDHRFDETSVLSRQKNSECALGRLERTIETALQAPPDATQRNLEYWRKTEKFLLTLPEKSSKTFQEFVTHRISTLILPSHMASCCSNASTSCKASCYNRFCRPYPTARIPHLNNLLRAPLLYICRLARNSSPKWILTRNGQAFVAEISFHGSRQEGKMERRPCTQWDCNVLCVAMQNT